MATRRLFPWVTAGCLVLSACSPFGAPPSESTSAPTTTTVTATGAPTTTAPPEPRLDPSGSYAVVAFTNHLPAFGMTATGVPDRPWARLHATRDYITITRLAAASNAKLVLSYSPVLMEQIAAAADGQWDEAARITATPANELTATDRDYIADVFFDSSAAQIDQFPRYRELADKRAAGRSLTTSEYRDVQVLFNLAWTSPLLLEEDPLLGLVAKGRGFSEDDKTLVLDAHLAALEEFLDSLRSLAAAGKIELATTPLANPTMPLLVRNRMEEDARAHVARGRELFVDAVEVEPSGLAPHRGLIDLAGASAMSEAAFDWVLVSGDGGTPPARLTAEEGNVLALPYAPLYDSLVAQDYFLQNPNAAAFDLVRRIADQLGGAAGGVETVVVDGTEPWGRYEDAGVAFLRGLFRQLGAAAEFTTALPSDINTSLLFDPGPYPELPDSYLREPAELAAWAYLDETRRKLVQARDIGSLNERTLERATRAVLEAQDSEWYRWFGAARSSGDDAYYDALFRTKLATIWELLETPAPPWAQVPLTESAPISPTRQNRTGAAAINIDNRISDSEWAPAGLYDERTSALIRRLFYRFDRDNLYLRVDFTTEVLGDSAPGFDLYLGGPAASGAAVTPMGNSIGFKADRVAGWRGTNPVRITGPDAYPAGRALSGEDRVAGFDGDSIEFAIELDAIQLDLRPGDVINFRIVDVTAGPEVGNFPAAGRGSFEVPNLLEGTELARIADRLRDDYGPGTYTYLIDSTTRAGTYDLAGLAVRLLGGPTVANPDDPGEVQFEITFREPLSNPWSAHAGFSQQTIDLYLEAYPGTETGAIRLLDGRIAATEEAARWDYAFTVDGWGANHFTADAGGRVSLLDEPLEYAVLADRRTILVTVDRGLLPPGNETFWRYGVVVLANQAIPSLGIHELRPLADRPDRFRLGGGTVAINDPMIIDMLHPDSGVQEAALLPPRTVLEGDPNTISVDSLARIPLLPG